MNFPISLKPQFKRTAGTLGAFFFLLAGAYSGEETPKPAVPFRAMPLAFGEVFPEGWMAAQLQADLKDGIAGNFPRVSDTASKKLFENHNSKSDGKPHLADDANRRGWWSGEHEAYYADGFFRTAWLARNDAGKKAAVAQLKAILAAQDADGYIGIYSPEIRLPQDGPDGELWTQSRIYQALLAYYEATGDKTILTAVEKSVKLTLAAYTDKTYFSRKGARDGGVSHGIGFTDSLEWLYRLTGDDAYRAGFLRLYADYAKGGTRDLDMIPTTLLDPKKTWRAHTPHTAEGLAMPIIAAAYGDSQEYAQAAATIPARLEKHSNPGGGLVGDEAIGGRTGSFDLTAEYCTYTETLGSLTRIAGYENPFLTAERAERIAFNGAQGARLHPAAGAVAYLSSDNRYEITRKPHGGRELYSPNHNAASCCALNATRLLPYYIDGMWMKSPDGTAIFARLYGPSLVKTRLRDTDVTIRETTNYPFSGKILFEITPAAPVQFALKLRIPAHTPNPAVKAPENMRIAQTADTVEIEGTWNTGDKVELNFTFAAHPVTAADGRVAVAYGPLLFSLPIESKEVILKKFPVGKLRVSEYFPATPVETKNYRLKDATAFKPVNLPNPDRTYPWANPPLGLVGNLVNEKDENVPVLLVPLGSTILRQTGFKPSNN